MSRSLIAIIASLLAAFVSPTRAANIMSFIESARHTPIAYVGIVKDVKETRRDDFYVWEHARVDVKVVGRGGDARSAGFPYPSYDAKTPPLPGGPEYVLKRGMWVLVFCLQFDDPEPPSYLRSGTREDLTKLIQTFSHEAAAMSDEQLKFNMISAEQRDQQVLLYRQILEKLTALP